MPVETPSQGRTTAWPRLSRGTTWRTVFDGTAKPMPTLPWLPAVAICEFTPMTRALASSSGPPELPGLIGASVWMTFSMRKPLGAWISRPEAGDDPRRRRAVQAERVADRDGLVADLDEVGVREHERVQPRRARRVDAQDGEVRGRVDPDDLRGELGALVVEAHLRRAGRSTTWAFVTIVPSPSMTKPVPTPRRCRARPGRRRPRGPRRRRCGSGASRAAGRPGRSARRRPPAASGSCACRPRTPRRRAPRAPWRAGPGPAAAAVRRRLRRRLHGARPRADGGPREPPVVVARLAAGPERRGRRHRGHRGTAPVR